MSHSQMFLACFELHACPATYAGNLAIMKLVLFVSHIGMLENSSILIFRYHSDILLPLLQQMYSL